MPGIGEQLKQARAVRGLTMKQVMQATRIRAYYLEAMETDDFAAMPSAAQARGFLRSYAEFLGLNAAELIERQRDESAAPAEFFMVHLQRAWDKNCTVATAPAIRGPGRSPGGPAAGLKEPRENRRGPQGPAESCH